MATRWPGQRGGIGDEEAPEATDLDDGWGGERGKEDEGRNGFEECGNYGFRLSIGVVALGRFWALNHLVKVTCKREGKSCMGPA